VNPHEQLLKQVLDGTEDTRGKIHREILAHLGSAPDRQPPPA